jgi:selenocysteine-specific elongation factor
MPGRTKHQPPGELKAGTRPNVMMMVCTAGHVDHGKTQLVRLLTGCETDRLKTEKERGLTIELGFAPCVLEGDLCVGIVDVPGHEKFVKNMVAGVSGIDMTILVVAADDGIMPQTVEHFQIMELLGVSHGIVALTKIDLVSEERISAVTEEIRGFLKGTFMEEAPICPVSSQTYDGFPEFYDALVGQAKRLSRRRRFGIFRMPVSHVFKQKGFGVVVMGIPVDGTIQVGAEVEVVPGNQKGKIVGIQQFLNETKDGEFGQCLALNIPAFVKKPPVRGQVLSLPGYLEPVISFHVRLKTIPNLQNPIRNAEQIKFHTGTIEQTGKIYLLENISLKEGEEGLATIVLAQPVVAAVGDRFIIRRLSPVTTTAGGEVLAVSRDAKRKKKKNVAEQLNAYLAHFLGVDPMSEEGLEKRVEYYLRMERKDSASLDEISSKILLHKDVVRDSLAGLIENKKVISLGADHYVHSETYQKLLAGAGSRLQKVATEEGTLSLTSGMLRQGFDWPARLWRRIEEDLQRQGVIEKKGNKFILRAAVEKLSGDDRRLMTRIQKIYADAGFHSPRPEELPDMTQASPKQIGRILDYLFSQKKLIRLSKNVVLDYGVFKGAQDMVVKIINEKGSLDSADFKAHIGSSRKYALAVLDFLDLQRITVRSGNIRKLMPDYQRNLFK